MSNESPRRALGLLRLLPGSRDRTATALAYLLAAIATGHAIQVANGTYNEEAFAWMVSGLALTLVGTLLPEWRPLERSALRLAGLAAAIGMAAAVGELHRRAPGIYLKPPPGPNPVSPFYDRLAFLIVAAAAGLAGIRKPSPRWQMPMLIAAFVSAAAWVIRTSPEPWIDVFVFQRDSSIALLHGQNPYAITFPNIYGNGAYYGPNMIEGGRLQFGFVYPPLSLFMAMIGHVLGGDYRYAQLASVALTAVMIARGPGRGSVLAAAAAGLLLLTPRGFFVLEQGWTEPLVLVLLAAVVFAADRAPRAMPYVLGLFFASKQYAILALPATVLLVGPTFSWRAYWNILWRATVAGAVVTLPLFLWAPKPFLHSVLELQFYQPFRDDALSILVWFKRTYATTPPVWPAFAGALAGGALALLRLPRTPAGFAGGVALVYYLFIALNKQAFTNYYFLVIGALLLAAGATLVQDERPAA